MPVWRAPGGKMGTVDLRELEGDQVVIHFGGSLTSVDAYTFANSLVAFADMARAVNNVLNPGQSIEVRLEAVGPGSFRAVVRRISKGLGGFFSEGARAILFGVIGTIIYENFIAEDTSSRIIINTDEVIIEQGGDRIIVPREVYEQAQIAGRDPEVRSNLRRTFEVVEKDEAIENFGLTKRLDDESPLVQIPRQDFARLSDMPSVVETGGKRAREERARLLVTKVWLKPGQHKWSFEWNGIPISARIKHDDFLQRFDRREFVIGPGDAIDATIAFEQNFDQATETWPNDPNTYAVLRVHIVISKDGRQTAV